MTEQQGEQQAPAWLIEKLNARIAHIEAEAGEGIDMFARQGGVQPFVMTPLTEPEEFGLSMEDWERSCDNCGTVTPEGEEFFTGNVIRKLAHGQLINITFGTCRACRDLPGPA